jgi:putative intracellular protease/amidase
MPLLSRRINQALILLAPGFIESTTVSCLQYLREAGFAVGLVGLSAGLTRGHYGLEVQADCALSQIQPSHSPRLLVIPDGKEAVAMLLADPRVHRLIRQTVRDDGRVAVMPMAEAGLRRASLLSAANESSFLLQGSMSLRDFLSRMVALLL